VDFIYDPSLVLYLPLWKLDGSSFADRSAYGHLCTVTGALWTPHGRDFDGDDYIELTDDGVATSPLNFTSGNFTIMVWLKISVLDATRVIYQRGLYNTDGFYWMLLSNGDLDSYSNQADANQRNLSTVGDIVVDEIALVTLVRTGTAITMYKNTDLLTLATTTAITDPATCSRTAKIGVHDDKAQRFWKGSMGEFWIYNRALTPLEIQHNFLATKWRYR